LCLVGDLVEEIELFFAVDEGTVVGDTTGGVDSDGLDYCGFFLIYGIEGEVQFW
jgi:hypothetical protein